MMKFISFTSASDNLNNSSVMLTRNRGRDLGNNSSNYFYDDVFSDTFAGNTLMGLMPSGTTQVRKNAPANLPSYWSRLYTTPLLTAEQETHCFRKYNYLKYLVDQRRQWSRSCVGCISMLDESEAFGAHAVQVRNLLIESNLRMVVSLAKHYTVLGSNEFDELISAGNAALVRAVEQFDFRRGIRFTTYAYQAIQRSMYELYRQEKRYRSKLIANGEEVTQSAPSKTADSNLAQLESSEVDRQLADILVKLDEREQQILKARFGIGRKGKSVAFKVIAKEFGLSTTRTAQLFHRAIKRLREAVAGLEETAKQPVVSKFTQ